MAIAGRPETLAGQPKTLAGQAKTLPTLDLRQFDAGGGSGRVS